MLSSERFEVECHKANFAFVRYVGRSGRTILYLLRYAKVHLGTEGETACEMGHRRCSEAALGFKRMTSDPFHLLSLHTSVEFASETKKLEIVTMLLEQSVVGMFDQENLEFRYK